MYTSKIVLEKKKEKLFCGKCKIFLKVWKQCGENSIATESPSVYDGRDETFKTKLLLKK